jgi:hypothetical protein
VNENAVLRNWRIFQEFFPDLKIVHLGIAEKKEKKNRLVRLPWDAIPPEHFISTLLEQEQKIVEMIIKTDIVGPI